MTQVYNSTFETRRIEKRVNAYIALSKLPLRKPIGAKNFNVLLEAIPERERDKYKKEIPFWVDDIKYTLVIK